MTENSGKRLGLFEAFGVELEYMIVDRDTLAIRAWSDRVLRDAVSGELAELCRSGTATVDGVPVCVCVCMCVCVCVCMFVCV